jgi:serine acetyltransferase
VVVKDVPDFALVAGVPARRIRWVGRAGMPLDAEPGSTTRFRCPRTGASIGARSVCVAPVTIGRWALVAAGSVVNKDVPDFALVAGVPARRLRWVGKAGVPLEPGEDAGTWVCPQTGEKYTENNEILTEAVAS